MSRAASGSVQRRWVQKVRKWDIIIALQVGEIAAVE